MPSLSTEFHPTPPFSLALTAAALTSFQGRAGADLVADGAYRRLLAREGSLFLLSVAERGTVDAPALEVSVSGPEVTPGDLDYGCGVAAHVLATSLDLAPFYEMASADAGLAPVAARFRGLHPPRHPTLFEGLTVAIAGQQIAAAVARRIMDRLVEDRGASLSLDGRVYRAFPSPLDVLSAGPAGLRAALFSGRKTEYLLGIATEAAAGRLEMDDWVRLPHAETVRRLSALRGVGRWTAEWVSLGVLGQLEAFPAGDLILRRVIAGHYLEGRDLTEAEARAWAERWGPLKGLATIYLFSAMRQERQAAREARSRATQSPAGRATS